MQITNGPVLQQICSPGSSKHKWKIAVSVVRAAFWSLNTVYSAGRKMTSLRYWGYLRRRLRQKVPRRLVWKDEKELIMGTERRCCTTWTSAFWRYQYGKQGGQLWTGVPHSVSPRHSTLNVWEWASCLSCTSMMSRHCYKTCWVHFEISLVVCWKVYGNNLDFCFCWS